MRAGYRVGFHFDPVIYYPGWREDYSALIESLFEKISPKDIAWISVGTFRFSPELKPAIERRFPRNRILDAEMLLGFDNKLRYPDALRYSIYKTLIGLVLKRHKKADIYLCMEGASMWRELKLRMPAWGY